MKGCLAWVATFCMIAACIAFPPLFIVLFLFIIAGLLVGRK